MKFVVSAEHRRFFKENGYIEFDEVVDHDKLSEIMRAIDKVLVERHGQKGALTAHEAFQYSRNLWMDSLDIKKFDCQGRLAEVVLSLSEKKELVLGYDQYLKSEASSYGSYYDTSFPEPLPLADISSVQGIACAMIVCLQGSDDEEGGFFPGKEGNVLFLSPQCIVDFRLLNQKAGKYLLIAFGSVNSVYLYNENDPNTHFNKKRGYVFGDKLLNKGHPTIRVR